MIIELNYLLIEKVINIINFEEVVLIVEIMNDLMDKIVNENFIIVENEVQINLLLVIIDN